jgi:hypothetical protein
VGIAEGSLSNSLTASLMSKSTRSSIMARVAWGSRKSETRSDEMSVRAGRGRGACAVKAKMRPQPSHLPGRRVADVYQPVRYVINLPHPA